MRYTDVPPVRDRVCKLQSQTVTAALAETGSPAAAPPKSPAEPQHARPPRYRWLRRVAVIAAVFFASVLAVRLWWGREAARRLATEVSASHARGEPIQPADFAPEEVPTRRTPSRRTSVRRGRW